jgi:hypothetical protein
MPPRPPAMEGAAIPPAARPRASAVSAMRCLIFINVAYLSVMVRVCLLALHHTTVRESLRRVLRRAQRSASAMSRGPVRTLGRARRRRVPSAPTGHTPRRATRHSSYKRGTVRAVGLLGDVDSSAHQRDRYRGDQHQKNDCDLQLLARQLHPCFCLPIVESEFILLRLSVCCVSSVGPV